MPTLGGGGGRLDLDNDEILLSNNKIIPLPRRFFNFKRAAKPRTILLPTAIRRRYLNQLSRDSGKIMGRTPCPYYSEAASCHQTIVTLFCGLSCWERAVEHRLVYGKGSVLVLDCGTDPARMLWPVWDRIVKIDWPAADWARLKRLERALRRDGADLVAGCDRFGERVLSEFQRCERDTLDALWEIEHE